MSYLNSSVKSLRVCDRVKTVKGFINAVCDTNRLLLAGTDLSRLRLYESLTALEEGREPMDFSTSTLLGGLSEHDAFAIVVPTRQFWYTVLDVYGNKYCAIPPTATPLRSWLMCVKHIWSEFYDKYGTTVGEVSPSRFQVYESKQALVEGRLMISDDSSIVGLGIAAETALAFVVLPDIEKFQRPLKRQKTIWRESNGLPTPVVHESLDDEPASHRLSAYIKLPAAFFDGFAIHRRHQHVIFYCRKAVLNMFDYLEKDVLQRGYVGYVYGPPGGGKTSAAVAFATNCVDREKWVVTCTRLAFGSCPMAVRLENNTKKTLEVSFDGDLSLEEILEYEDASRSKKHLVIIDNVVQTNDALVRACLAWVCHGWNGRLVFMSRVVNSTRRYRIASISGALSTVCRGGAQKTTVRH